MPPEPEPSPGGLPVPPVVVPRWIQLVLLPLAILGLWELARAIGPVLLILIFASVVALILNSPVKALERHGIPRPLAIPLMYVAVLAALALVGLLLSTPITSQVSHFQHNIPSIVHNANRELGDVQTWLDHRGIHIHIEKQGQTALDTLEKSISKRSGDIVSFSSDLLQKLAEISFGLILSLVLSIYFLIYSESIGNLVRRVMPPGDGTREDDYPHRIQRAVLGYVRGQLTFSFLMGASAGISLWIFGMIGIFPDGRHYALFFGVFYGLMELVPYLGPFLGALPPVLVALLVHPITAVWLVILFVVLQELEGHIVAPQVFRISLRINPILIILALLIGDELYGIAGALLALPVSAVLRETVLYLRRHLVLEPWSTAVAGAVGAGTGAGGVQPGGGADPGPGGAEPGPGGAEPGPGGAEPGGGIDGPPDRCPDCQALAGPGDAFCRSCGSSLEPRVGTPG
jgi:predicted PurR-regulated permease PerM